MKRLPHIVLAMVVAACVLLLASCDERQVAMLLEDALKDGEEHHPSPHPPMQISWTSNSIFKAYQPAPGSSMLDVERPMFDVHRSAEP